MALVNEKPTLRFARKGAEKFPLSPYLDGVRTPPDLDYPFSPSVGDAVPPAFEGNKAIPADFPRDLYIEGLGEGEGKRFKMTLFKVPAVDVYKRQNMGRGATYRFLPR